MIDMSLEKHPYKAGGQRYDEKYVVAVGTAFGKGKGLKLYIPSAIASQLNGTRRFQFIIPELGGILILIPIHNNEISKIYQKAEAVIEGME